jgi:hypothetical protein
MDSMEWFRAWHTALGIDQIEFSVGGIDLFRPEELEQAQVGYAVAEDGKSLVSAEPGAWQADWVAIAYETSFGDVIFASRTAPHAVFTAEHGQGRWEPRAIAPSLAAFGACLEAFREYAADRGNPADLEDNPPTAEEKRAFLEAVRRHTEGSESAVNFWELTAEIQQGEN